MQYQFFFFAIKNEHQEMVHACKNQELLARLRKSLLPRGVASSMHGINVHIKIVEEKIKLCKVSTQSHFISRLSMILWVNIVLKRTVVVLETVKL